MPRLKPKKVAVEIEDGAPLFRASPVIRPGSGNRVGSTSE
jgi:hypothetical protein